MPIVSGTSIGLDNTCKSVSALQEFFGVRAELEQNSALAHLTQYQAALKYDLQLFSNPEKHARLSQINHLISGLKQFKSDPRLQKLNIEYPTYPNAIKALINDQYSNLYSVLLRPTAQDFYIKKLNQVFSVERTNDESGAPRSPLYNALMAIPIPPQRGKRGLLINAVLSSEAGQANNFLSLVETLEEKTKLLFGIDIDFSEYTKDSIDAEMLFDENTTANEYIDALLAFSAPELFSTMNEPPFNTIQTSEELSMLTQFFLAQVNVYCKSLDLSTSNFGIILDDNPALSQELAGRIVFAYTKNLSVENLLLQFINKHAVEFDLQRALRKQDIRKIKRRFVSDYKTIKVLQNFDEFLILDTLHPGLFVTHQGAIGIDFIEYVRSGLKINEQSLNDIYENYPNTHDIINNRHRLNGLSWSVLSTMQQIAWNMSVMSNHQSRWLQDASEIFPNESQPISQMMSIPHDNSHISNSISISFLNLSLSQLALVCEVYQIGLYRIMAKEREFLWITQGLSAEAYQIILNQFINSETDYLHFISNLNENEWHTGYDILKTTLPRIINIQPNHTIKGLRFFYKNNYTRILSTVPEKERLLVSQMPALIRQLQAILPDSPLPREFVTSVFTEDSVKANAQFEKIQSQSGQSAAAICAEMPSLWKEKVERQLISPVEIIARAAI
jgi:hypothetical protein